MNSAAEFILGRKDRFTVRIPAQQDTTQWFINELINAPYAATTIDRLSYRSVPVSDTEKDLHIGVQYLPKQDPGPVFLVRNRADLATAVSLSLRLYQRDTTFVIDNRTHFISPDEIAAYISCCQEGAGEELQTHQTSGSHYSWRSMFDDRFIVYRMQMKYFDSARDTNALLCILAEQAALIKKRCRGRTVDIANAMMTWFRDNISYKNRNQVADHSAVGLYRNRTAVCQGIAAYAYQFFSLCGIDARYVSGEGKGPNGWAPHGWNMIRVNGAWHHIDYTFELNRNSDSVFRSGLDFQKDHRWDKKEYSTRRCNEIARSRQKARQSVVILNTDSPYFTVNKCVVDMTGTHPMCYNSNRSVRVAILDVISMHGGCYRVKDNSLCIYMCGSTYTIPLKQVVQYSGTWYTDIAWLPRMGIGTGTHRNTIMLRNINF